MKQFVVLLLAISGACSSPAILIKNDAPIPKLGISLETPDPALISLYEGLDQELGAYIDNYNLNPKRKFILYRASPDDMSTLHIRLLATHYVTPGEQAAGLMISAVGFATPFALAAGGAPIIFFFYYFPHVKSMTELSFSPDLVNPQQSKRELLYTSPGFLKSPEKQQARHITNFDKYIGSIVRQIEKQLPANPSRQTRQYVRN